jgi:small subunit ribosomal protein S3
MIEKDFVTEGLKRTRIDEYLENELERAGYGGMDIQLTPLGTMIVVYAERPGMVIGRGGKTVRNITQNLKSNYGLENPQVEVKEVDVPELNPKIMAHKIAAMLQRGMHFRRVAYTALRRIMGSGAQGVEVTISGKIRGARSATAKFSDGYIKKCGEPSIKYVKEGFATVQLKPGVLGIYVRIMPPEIVLPDKVEILKKTVEEEAEPVESISETLEVEETEESQEQEIEEEIEENSVDKVEETEKSVEKTVKSEKTTEDQAENQDKEEEIEENSVDKVEETEKSEEKTVKSEKTTEDQAENQDKEEEKQEEPEKPNED